MAGLRIEFAQFGGFDTFDILRSDSPMDVGSLPSPLVTGLTTMYYVDTSVVVGSKYYFRVIVWRDGVSSVSAELSITANSDPNWSNVVQLVHFDGEDGSTSFPDSSLANLSPVAYGNAKITDNGIIGAGSLLLDGASYAMTSYSSLLNLQSIDFTCEVWVNISASGYVMHFFAGTSDRWAFSVETDGKVAVYTTVGNTYITTSNSVKFNTDTLIEVNMTAAGFLRVFIGGVLGYSGTPFSGLGGGSAPRLEYGAAVGFNAAYLIGKLDEPRVTRNVIRNTSNYKPSKNPWPEQ